MSHNRKYATPERDAIIRQWWETDRMTTEILQLVNALPGVPYTRRTLLERAAILNLRRPEGWRSEVMRRNIAAKPHGTLVWSEERVAVLKEGWTSGVRTDELVKQVNALPGPAVNKSGLQGRAAKLHLLRPLKKPAPVVPQFVAKPLQVIVRRPRPVEPINPAPYRSLARPQQAFSMLGGRVR